MKGMTIFEILLVLVIAGAILLLGMRQYQVFKMGADAEELKDIVNNIAVAAANYYRANCDYSLKATSPFWQEDPPQTGHYITIDIKNDLEAGGFLRPQKFNALVYKTSTDPYEGFTVRFNPYVTPVQTCTQSSGGVCQNKVSTGFAINWLIWVTVCLKNPTQGTFLKSATDALDLTASCDTGSRLFFSFIPTQVLLPQSSNALIAPVQQQFKQMYTTDNQSYLLSTTGAADTQYYYCGS
jgi:type II secretory pathway pseudopilin PulG